MTKDEKLSILRWCHSLTDSELHDAWLDATIDCLGSVTEDMYDMGFDISDILEQERYERFLAEKAELIESVVVARGLWCERIS